MNEMLFAELDIKTIDKERTIKWIDSLDEKYWFWNKYRSCDLLALMNQTGYFNEESSENTAAESSYVWTDFVPDFIKEYFNKNIFTWTQMKSRILIIRTKAYKENNIHIDCSPSRFHTLQHKFRIVIQGATNGLYFQTKKGRVFAPYTQKPFIMDGSWPHGMINNSPVPKYTIALGAPWTGCDFYPGYNPLLFISRDQLPESYEQLFDFRKYKVR